MRQEEPEERLSRSLSPTAPPHGPVAMVLRGALIAVGMALLTFPYFILCILLLPWRPLRLRLGNWVGSNAGKWVFRLSGITYDVVGEDLRSLAPAIFVQNHTGTLDLWLSMQLCPSPGSGTMKREMLKIPFVGIGYLLSGHLILDRQNRERSIKAMNEIRDLVHTHQISVWILPEGTRSKTGRLSAFKKGFAHLALATGLPIVPVVVHRVHEFWPRGLKVRPGRVTVEVLPPISTADWTLDNLAERVDAVREVFVQRLGADQRPE